MSGIHCRRGRLKIFRSNAVSISAARQFVSGGTASGRCLRPGKQPGGELASPVSTATRSHGAVPGYQDSTEIRRGARLDRQPFQSRTPSHPPGYVQDPPRCRFGRTAATRRLNSQSAPVNPHPRQLLGQCPWARCLCRLETRCRRTVTLYGRWSSAWRVATSECAPRCRNSTAHCKRKAANARGGALHGNARIRRSAP